MPLLQKKKFRKSKHFWRVFHDFQPICLICRLDVNCNALSFYSSPWVCTWVSTIVIYSCQLWNHSHILGFQNTLYVCLNANESSRMAVYSTWICFTTYKPWSVSQWFFCKTFKGVWLPVFIMRLLLSIKCPPSCEAIKLQVAKYTGVSKLSVKRINVVSPAVQFTQQDFFLHFRFALCFFSHTSLHDFFPAPVNTFLVILP